MRHYFAYGSNMSVRQMKARCPGAVAVGTASLGGWGFFVNRRGTASVRRLPGRTVHGVVWRVTHRCVTTLDHYEGVRLGRYRIREVTVTHAGAPLRAFLYAGADHSTGRPVRAYLEGVVIPAAQAWGLPDAYVAELDGWFGRHRIGPARPRLAGRSWKA